MELRRNTNQSVADKSAELRRSEFNPGLGCSSRSVGCTLELAVSRKSAVVPGMFILSTLFWCFSCSFELRSAHIHCPTGASQRPTVGQVFPVVFRIFTVISGDLAVVASVSTVASIVPTAPVVAVEVFSVSTVVFGTPVASRIYSSFNIRDQEPFQA